MSKNLLSVIEVTDSHVKLVQAKTQGAKRGIVSCDAKQINFHSDEELTKTLFDITRSKSFDPEKLFFIIPRRFVILKRLRLPSQNESELRKMIDLQLVNQIPYSPEEVLYDYQLLDKDTEGYSNVLVIIVNKEVTARYLKVLNEAGIKSAKMTLSSFGLLKWFQFQEEKTKASKEGALVVNVDYMHTEIGFFDNGKLLFSRSVNYGEKDLNDEGVEGLAKEVELSYSTYQKERLGPVIKRVIVVSSLPEAELLKGHIREVVDLSTEVQSPLDGISLPKKMAQVANHPGWSLAVSLGMCLSSLKDFINLTPQEVHEDKKQSVRKKEWAVFLVLFALAFGCSAAFFGIDIFLLKSELKQLEEQNANLRPKIKQAKTQQEFIEALNQEFQERIHVPEVINELYALTPTDISFRSLFLDDRKVLTIQGYAEGSAGVNTLQQALLRSSAFDEVNLQFATKRRIFNMEVTDFKMSTKIKAKR